MQILAKELIQVQIWYVLYISHVIPVVLDFILKADIWDYKQQFLCLQVKFKAMSQSSPQNINQNN